MLSHKISTADQALYAAHQDACSAARRINLGGTITHAEARAIEDLNGVLSTSAKLISVPVWEKMHRAAFTRWAD